MKIAFVAGFGPIIGPPDGAHAFWRDGLGITNTVGGLIGAVLGGIGAVAARRR